jgi:RNA polymerase sigma factor (sigma-70 family)
MPSQSFAERAAREPGAPPTARRAMRLADPALAEALSHFVSGRVPASDVDDIVQSTLAEALAAARAPDGPDDGEELRRWVHGIARHKVVDWFRARRREVPLETFEASGAPVASAASTAVDAAATVSEPEGAADAKNLLRWAERELPTGAENARTLEWLLREGQGESLEAIAAEADVEAPRVRQRVSRLRKHFRTRWAAELAALAALVVVAIVVALAMRTKREPVAPRESPSSEPMHLEPLPMPLPVAPPPEARPAGSAGPVAPDSSGPSVVPRPMSTSAPPAKPSASPVGKRKPTRVSSGTST